MIARHAPHPPPWRCPSSAPRRRRPSLRTPPSGGSGAATPTQNFAITLNRAPHEPSRRRKCITTVVHVSIVSPLVRPVCHIAPGMQPARLHQTHEAPSAAFTICTPINAWLKRETLSSCHLSERPTRARVFRASSGRPDESSNLLTVAPAHGSTHRGRAASPTNGALGVGYRLGAATQCVKLQA